jgi:sRNA-binding carbon storage regulator CsrA
VTLIKVKSLLDARIGFQADASVIIDREEVHLMKQQTQEKGFTK